jgi:tRNA pseudouridine38-40 synthase
VGEQRREQSWASGLLGSDRRSSDFNAAPAKGLTMIAVDYPPDDQLEERTLVTRELRIRTD